jgi:hypothetical protein
MQQVSASARRKLAPAAVTSVPPSIWWNTIAVERAGNLSVSPGRNISAE